jgi:hypothetical protein
MFAVALVSGGVAGRFPNLSLLPGAVLPGSGFLLHHALFLPHSRRPSGLIPTLLTLGLASLAVLVVVAPLYTVIVALLAPAIASGLATLIRHHDGPARMDALPSNLAGALALSGPSWTLAFLGYMPSREALLLWGLLALQNGVGVLLVQSRLPRSVSRTGPWGGAFIAAGFGLLLPPLHAVSWALLVFARPVISEVLSGRIVPLKSIGRLEGALQILGAVVLVSSLKR